MPDIGDPFLVSTVFKPVPQEENAFPKFEEAFALLKEVDEADSENFAIQQENGWDPAACELNKYLKMNRPALEKWREATEKGDYQVVPIDQASELIYFTKIRANRDLVRWCQTEIERLSKTGKPADVFPWLRASFRCSGLVTRSAPKLNRIVGAAIFNVSASSTEKWMQHPDVTSDQLLELLAVVQAADRLMETPSTTVKVDYLVSRREFARWSYDEMKSSYEKFGGNPPLGSKVETWLLAEPEYSRRLIAHVTANHLAFVDDPRRDRPPLLDGDIFDESAIGVTPKGRLPAHTLIELLRDAKLIETGEPYEIAGFLDFIDRQQARYGCLQVALAAQAFYRIRGEYPRDLPICNRNFCRRYRMIRTRRDQHR